MKKISDNQNKKKEYVAQTYHLVFMDTAEIDGKRGLLKVSVLIDHFKL